MSSIPDTTAFIDLEGVLCPEMWPFLGQRLGLNELMATTRENPDYRGLMVQRIAALRKHGVTITQIQKELAALELMDGAEDFIRQLSSRVQVVIVSDSFRPMNEALLGRIGASRIFCHSFTVDAAGLISGFNLWNDLRGKHEVLDNVPCDPARCLALGDALNDLGLLRAVGCGVLFRPSAATREQAKDLIWSSTYPEVRALFAAHMDGQGALLSRAVASR